MSMSNRNGWRALACTRAQRGLLVLGWVALAGCQQATQQNRLSVPVEPTKAADDSAESGPPLLVAPDDQPDEAMLARALCDVVGECVGGATEGSEEGEGAEGEAGAEDTAAGGEREVHHELADLDADGRNEVLVRVRQHDYVIWHVLARRDDAYVSLYELADNGTDIRAVQNASGRPLLLLEHDCCCQYNLQVLALEGDTFERLFSWGSACEDGCDSGYEAYLMFDDAQRLTSIALPEGVCGADGTTYIDTTTWEPAAS
jgi:hypothetical protein